MAEEVIYDDVFVTYAGRTMLRVAGGETVQPEEPEAPAAEATPPEPEGKSGPQPEAGTPAAEQEPTDWEQRYKDLQSTYTKTSQEAAQLREAQQARDAETSFVQALSDPEQQTAAWQSLVEQLGDDGARKWAEEHGFNVEDDKSETEQLRDPRVDQLLSEREQEKQNAQAQQVEQQMESDLTEALKEKGIKPEDFGQELRDLILDAAVLRPTDDGTPDVKGVFAQWAAADAQRIKAYRATKRDQPTPPVSGSSGTPNPSLGDKKERLARMHAIAEEAFQSS